MTAPIPSRLQGSVRLYPAALPNKRFALDRDGLHHWGPIAPHARVEVSFHQPALNWSGDGYFDSNAGVAPLEDTFARWDWSRWRDKDQTLVLYDTEHRDGDSRSLALRYNDMGDVEPFEPPRRTELPKTGWRVRRAVQTDPAVGANVTRTLEDTPFYARSIVSGQPLDTPLTGMHESLSLDRFRSPVVQAMLPFRIPRRSG